MARFAEKTTVAPEKSRMEIETTLRRYGATGFAYAWMPQHAVVGFEASGRRVKFALPMPDPKERRFTHVKLRGYDKARAATAAQAAWEQDVRQRWRALALAIKAKLEAVEAGITEFESEFLAHIILPNGETVGDWMKPQIALAYQEGKMPPLLGYEGKPA